ncbi:LysE family transporter [Candidatus Babeliales bacterium]|nr:LysE family transporter [Candidatus Babeliales bacterium]
MSFWFLVSCFFIGIAVSSSVGPIFIWTFNRGARHGFFQAFPIALGAALVDGIYFSLGLLGGLKLLETSRNILLGMDIIGGIILVVLGARTIMEHQKQIQNIQVSGFFKSVSKSFLVTLFNPFTALFFMFVSVQLLPAGMLSLSTWQVAMGSTMVFGGSLCILSTVGLIASYVGNAISHRALRLVSLCTGTLFLIAGVYLLCDFVLTMIKIIRAL